MSGLLEEIILDFITIIKLKNQNSFDEESFGNKEDDLFI